MDEVSLDILDSGTIHARAEVGRQLCKVGTLDHLPRLLRAAREDGSPGVRLYAVCAVADILSRHRVGPNAELLTPEAREKLFVEARGIDPGFNAGVFSVLANLGLPLAARRILVGVRDPRLDVRTGALVGLTRYLTSADGANDLATRAELVSMLEDARVRPDALARVTKLAACCGWQEARKPIERLLGREDQVAESAQQALDWLTAAAEAAPLFGVWVSDGRDATEIRPAVGALSALVISRDQLIEITGATAKATSLTRVEPTRLVHKGGATSDLRRMVLTAPETEREGPAFQLRQVTWFAATTAETHAAIDVLVDAHPPVNLTADTLAVIRQAVGDGAGGRRAVAQLDLRTGRYAEAKDALEQLIDGKRPTPELWLWLGIAKEALGDVEGARAAWVEVTQRASKKSPALADALRRLGNTADPNTPPS